MYAVKKTSSRMTSLSINARRVDFPAINRQPKTALRVGGWLEFGHLESGWSYSSATTRQASSLNYPGPAFDLVTAAEHLHPRVCATTSASDACVMSRVDMHAVHAKLNARVIENAMSKAEALHGKRLTPSFLLASYQAPFRHITFHLSIYLSV